MDEASFRGGTNSFFGNQVGPCPHCGGTHTWNTADAFLPGDPPPLRTALRRSLERPGALTPSSAVRSATTTGSDARKSKRAAKRARLKAQSAADKVSAKDNPARGQFIVSNAIARQTAVDHLQEAIDALEDLEGSTTECDLIRELVIPRLNDARAALELRHEKPKDLAEAKKTVAEAKGILEKLAEIYKKHRAEALVKLLLTAAVELGKALAHVLI